MVYIEARGTHVFDHEEHAVYRECQRRHLPVAACTKKQLMRQRLSLSRSDIVVGTLPLIYGALHTLSIQKPLANPYPYVLRDVMRRKLWIWTLDELRWRVQQQTFTPLFIKPAKTEKRFTGYICYDERDILRLDHISKHQLVYCVEPVTFVAEYRVYITKSVVQGVEQYEGPKAQCIPRDFIARCIYLLDTQGESHAGYSLDVGILRTGDVALVEMNDGFSLGLYGELSYTAYTDLLFARWEELMNT